MDKMEKVPSIKRRGRKIIETKAQAAQTSIKWTDAMKIQMASYLKDNYEIYKNIGSNKGIKLNFLKKMKDYCMFECTDKQMSNGFDALLKKYKEIKGKLDETGFGVDSDRDKSIEEGFIKAKCPCFHTLDEVLGTRVNISPPTVLSSDSPPLPVLDLDDGPVSSDEDLDSTKYDQKPSTSHCSSERSSLKAAMKRKSDALAKMAGGLFTSLLSDKMSMANEFEAKKLKLEEEKFAHAKELEEKKFESEREARKFELEKLQMQQNFELEKLKLQIELQKLKND